MTNLSEQKIIVFCDFSASMDDAVTHGVRIAGIFGKELCLFHPLGSGGKEERQEAQKKLGKVIRDLKERETDLSVSSLTLKGDLAASTERLAEDYDGIMLVLTSDEIQEKFTALQQSSIPFLFVNGRSEEYLQYNRVMLSVDDTQVVKNTALWGTYFGRFNQADIEILVAGEKKEEQQRQIKKNLKVINELLTNLKLKVHINQSDKNAFNLYAEAFHNSLDERFNLLIIPYYQQINISDRISGLPDAPKIISQAGELPVLCINSHRDMYILCD
jgi:hypothetical protein